LDQSQILNATGRFIWILCDGTHDRQDILEALKDQFAVEGNLLAYDLDIFLDDLIDKGYLCIPG
jgi:Coenzyme PQQ synthesis protein D (PqqD)